jgi:hypothetical protein
LFTGIPEGGTLSQNGFEASERNLADFMNRKANE